MDRKTMKRLRRAFKRHNRAFIMTPARKKHARKVFYGFAKEGMAKYATGQKEHGGDLWRKNTIGMMREELIDHMCYLDVAEDQWKECTQIARNALGPNYENTWISGNYDHVKALKQILNILTTGNKEGIQEARK